VFVFDAATEHFDRVAFGGRIAGGPPIAVAAARGAGDDPLLIGSVDGVLSRVGHGLSFVDGGLLLAWHNFTGRYVARDRHFRWSVHEGSWIPNPSGTRFIGGALDVERAPGIEEYDGEGVHVRTLLDAADAAAVVSWSPDGRVLAVTGAEVLVLDASTGARI